MKIQDILRLRLSNQHLSTDRLGTPEKVVSWLGAVQAQDYSGAKYSIGLRGKNLKETDIEKAIANRSIIRTWPMRGTLHFVSSTDVRWMLSLLTPRIISGMAGRNRQLELDDKVFRKSHDLLIKAMEGGKQLMRGEVYDVLENHGITTSGQRGIHIINYLAQNQVLCHGSHNEKQPTYALLDEWIPTSKKLEEDEALAEIALRYFMSHGPATIKDLVWWTRLKLSDATKGLHAVAQKLISKEVDGNIYWFSPELPDKIPAKTAYLLPGFDEYMLGYTNRSLMVDKKLLPKIVPGNNGMFMPTIVIDGSVKGLWKRTLKNDTAIVELRPFEKLSQRNLDSIQSAAKRYGKYLDRSVTIETGYL